MILERHGTESISTSLTFGIPIPAPVTDKTRLYDDRRMFRWFIHTLIVVGNLDSGCRNHDDDDDDDAVSDDSGSDADEKEPIEAQLR